MLGVAELPPELAGALPQLLAALLKLLIDLKTLHEERDADGGGSGDEDGEEVGGCGCRRRAEARGGVSLPGVTGCSGHGGLSTHSVSHDLTPHSWSS